MSAMQPVTDRLIEVLELKGNEHVLDVASGTGEPGLTLSTLLPKGRVTGTDLSEKMVAIANGNAHQRGTKNYRSQVGDASNMPFEDNYFDHVICRFGIIYFPNIEDSLNEMSRVLKPGGKLVVTVWTGPENNSCFTLMGTPVMEKLELPKPHPNAPGIFRFAQPDITSHLLLKTDLIDVNESIIRGNLIFDTAQHYWNMTSDVSGPIVEALKNTSKEVVKDIKTTVFNNAQNFIKDGKVFTSWEARVVAGTKKRK